MPSIILKVYEYIFESCGDGANVRVDPIDHVVSFSGLKGGHTYGDCSFQLSSEIAPSSNSLHIDPFTILGSSFSGGSTVQARYNNLLDQFVDVVLDEPVPSLDTKTNIDMSKCLIFSTLKFGSQSEEVKCLQTILGGLAVDGIFGSKTKNAAILFQEANGLDGDGIVGSLTRAKLK